MRWLARQWVDDTSFSDRALMFAHNVLGAFTYPETLELNIAERSEYGWPMWRQANVARRLGLQRVTAIEFGVAGGAGLLAMERHAHAIELELGVRIDVIGVDTGKGLPAPTDARDHPYAWSEGDFRMNPEALRARLNGARLILADVRDDLAVTVGAIEAPVAFIAFDLDLYTSTAAALNVLLCDVDRLMPRVVCYFDNCAGGPELAYTHYAGELLAIREFNARNERIKIDNGLGIRTVRPTPWSCKLFVAHLFDHPLYRARTVPSADL